MSEILREYGLVLIAIISVAAVLLVGTLAAKYAKLSMAGTYNAMMGNMGKVENYMSETDSPDEGGG